jgi:hypothetical protein
VWRDNDWTLASGQRAKHVGLLKRLLKAKQGHHLRYEPIDVLSGSADFEHCRRLAHDAMNETFLDVDEDYSVVRHETEKRAEKDRCRPARSRGEINKKGQQKIRYEGDPCRKCGMPVRRKRTSGKTKPGQTFRYDYYFFCESCGTIYLDESARVCLDSEQAAG